MNPSDFLEDCKIIVGKNAYSVIKAKAFPENLDCFAMIRDFRETTVVAETNTIPESLILAEEKNWKLITFQATLPFELVGFLAIVSKVLADEKIPIFALSAYSTDHLLIKENHLAKALDRLLALGCVLVES